MKLKAGYLKKTKPINLKPDSIKKNNNNIIRRGKGEVTSDTTEI